MQNVELCYDLLIITDLVTNMSKKYSNCTTKDSSINSMIS